MLRLNEFKLPILAALLSCLLLAACGKKGPLYLPDRPRAPDQTRPSPN